MASFFYTITFVFLLHEKINHHKRTKLDKLQEVGFTYDGIILNAAAYTHTSVGIGDAIKAITTPVIEVHISNTYSREEFRHFSYISPVAKGVILGFGLQSYELAIQSFSPS